MAHEFDSGAFVRESAWHKLGVVIPDYLPPSEMQVAAGLDWEVDLREVYVSVTSAYGDDLAVVPDRFAVVRSDREHPLGIVGNKYTAIQNEVMFEFAEGLLDDSSVRIETAGSLKEGRWVWLQAKIGDDFSIAGDPHATYLTVASSHDGSLAFSVFPTHVRVVCANTFTAAWSSKTRSYKVKHTTNHEIMLSAARQALEIVFNESDEFRTGVERLMNEAATDERFFEIMHDLVPIPDDAPARTITTRNRARAQLTDLYYGPTNGFRGTAWGIVNPFNEWEQWAPAGPKVNVAERAATKFLSGDTGKLTNKAFAAVGAGRKEN